MRNNRKTPVNPSSFAGALTERHYAKKVSKREGLVAKRQQLIDWLRKKFKNNKRARALADKLDSCRRHSRCKSATCPECAYAAQRLFAKTASKYLKGKEGIVWVTIVPADGAITPGGLS